MHIGRGNKYFRGGIIYFTRKSKYSFRGDLIFRGSKYYVTGLQLETDISRPLPQLEQLRPSSSKDQPRFPTASNESSRFKLASEQQLSELAKGLIPENTKGSTKAVCPFTHAKTVRRETTSHRFFLSLFVTCRCYSIYEHAQRWTNQVGHITVIARVARDLWLRP